jgi:hypothetical protein
MPARSWPNEELSDAVLRVLTDPELGAHRSLGLAATGLTPLD